MYFHVTVCQIIFEHVAHVDVWCKYVYMYCNVLIHDVRIDFHVIFRCTMLWCNAPLLYYVTTSCRYVWWCCKMLKSFVQGNATSRECCKMFAYHVHVWTCVVLCCACVSWCRNMLNMCCSWLEYSVHMVFHVTLSCACIVTGFDMTFICTFMLSYVLLCYLVMSMCYNMISHDVQLSVHVRTLYIYGRTCCNML